MSFRKTCLLIIVATVLIVSPAARSEDPAGEQARIKAALAKTTGNVADAVKMSQQAGIDGMLVEARLVFINDEAIYWIEYLEGDQILKVEIPAESMAVRRAKGEQLGDERQHWAALFERGYRDAKAQPVREVGVAERKVGPAKAYELAYELKDNKLFCAVELLAGDKLVQVEIDPATGQVLGVKDRSAAGRQPTMLNFDQDTVDKLPAGWNVRATHPTQPLAVWKVVADATAPSKPNVLALAETKSPDQTFNLAVLDNTALRNLEFTVRIKAVSGKEDQGGGPIWRCKDENNYYICRFNPLEGNFRVYVVKDGQRKQLASEKVETQADKWYQVRVIMLRDRILCYLDDKQLLAAMDSTFTEPGMVGLWTKADAATRFDDLYVAEIIDQGKPAAQPGKTGK